jgi:ABC-type multidrug transport system fused ATPase/permease subunit
VNKKQERLVLLEKQIERVNRRITLLDRQSYRYSWIRVGIFFGGLSLSAAGLLIGWWIAVGLLVVTMGIFAVFVYQHGKIDRSLSRHRIWLEIKQSHVARIRLDWERIPFTYTPALREGHPFEIDLDMTGERSLHHLLNTTVSREGGRRLSDWLLTLSPDLQTIRKRQALVHELTPLTRFRDKLLLHSLRASGGIAEQLEGKRLLRWLAQNTSCRAARPLFWISTGLNLLTIVLLALSLFGYLPHLWLLTLIGSVSMIFVTGHFCGSSFDDASYLRYAFAMLEAVFAYLERYPYGSNRHVKQLCKPFFADPRNTPSRLLEHVGRIAGAATLRQNGLLWLMVNAVVPWDSYCAYQLSRYKEQIGQRLPEWLEAWFELEAHCSLATFAYLNPEYTLPEIEEGERVHFQARELGHPLLAAEKKVTNDFALNEQGEIVIITGSNMSGKSTFLRTLGVNLCLAYAGGPVNAGRLQTSLFRVFTCIRVSDSVVEGYSYFYAEVRRLRQLLTALEQEHAYPLFFLIDEIFKGTNNRERLLGSRAYVQALVGKNCVGLISTHDLELVRLAEELPLVRNAHFREEIIEGDMIFDYILRPGPCPTTNALKIMKMEGLPVEEGGKVR